MIGATPEATSASTSAPKGDTMLYPSNFETRLGLIDRPFRHYCGVHLGRQWRVWRRTACAGRLDETRKNGRLKANGPMEVLMRDDSRSTRDHKFPTPSRRAVVQAGLAAVAAPAVLNAIPAQAQSRIVKIGHVSPKTGP